jgi:hypothetical protein
LLLNYKPHKTAVTGDVYAAMPWNLEDIQEGQQRSQTGDILILYHRSHSPAQKSQKATVAVGGYIFEKLNY